MKKLVPILAAVAVCVIVVLESVHIARLEKEVDRLQSYINGQVNTLSRNIDGIYGEVQSMLEEEANQLAESGWEYGEIDVGKRTAEVICTVLPKVYTPNATKASIVCSGREYALTYRDGKYTANITLPLFERSEFSMVKLDDSGTIRSQKLRWVTEPRYEALLLTYAGMQGSATGKPGNGEYVWSVKNAVNTTIESRLPYRIRSAEFVEVLDGKEIRRTPIDLSEEGQKTYKDALLKNNKPVPEYLAEEKAVGVEYEGDKHYIYYLEEEYHIPNGSMMEFYVDVVDGNGLRYRSFADCLAISESGYPDEERMEEKTVYSSAETVVIFDEDGNVVYSLDEGMFGE